MRLLRITKEYLESLRKRKTPLQAAKEKKKARNELMKVVLPKLSNILETTTKTYNND